MYSLNGIRIRNNNYFNALEMLRGYVKISSMDYERERKHKKQNIYKLNK